MNDIGLYGGPGACGWNTNVLVEFSVAIENYIGVTINPAQSGRYRIEYTSDLASGTWVQATNLLLNAAYTFVDFDSPLNANRFYRAVLLP